MSPFAEILKELRTQRDMRQVRLAELVGYEQSYISAVENGGKAVPTEDFIERVILVLCESQAEAAEVRAAAKASIGRIVIPPDAREDEYHLLADLREALPHLSRPHVRLLMHTLMVMAGKDYDELPPDDPRERLARARARAG